MRKLAFLMIATALTANGATAQDRKEMCASIAPSMLQASDGMGGMITGLADMDFATVGASLGGDEGARFTKLASLRDAMMPEMEAFVKEFDAAALDLRACAR